MKTHSGDCHWWSYKVCDCGYLMRANSGDFGEPSEQVIKDFLEHSHNCQSVEPLKAKLAAMRAVLERHRACLHSEQSELGKATIKALEPDCGKVLLSKLAAYEKVAIRAFKTEDEYLMWKAQFM